MPGSAKLLAFFFSFYGSNCCFEYNRGLIGRQASSDRSFYISFTALQTDTCSERSYPFVFATNLLSEL